MIARESTTGKATVLFVDPFASICEVVALILQSSGYRVITATSTSEVLRIASNEDSLDLLLLDDDLPSCDREELTDRFLERNPDGRVLKLLQPRYGFDVFRGKSLVDYVADALRSRSHSVHRAASLA